MTTFDRFQLSPLVRLANGVGGGLTRLPMFDLAPETLRAAAEHETGLNDWGQDNFWPGFETLFHAIAADDSQSLVGKLSLRIDGLHRLKNRLMLEAALKLEPGILTEAVRQPLFIIGFPRTGTTMLHKLLAQDPNVSVPIYWKLYTPLPLNVPQAEIERRIKDAESLMRFAAFVAPQWEIIHPTGAHEPEECVFLLSDSLNFAVRANIPSYIDEYLSLNLNPVYENFKQHLQALQWQQPEHPWVLKSPLHLWALDALLNVFPGARIVMTHRDPKKAFASWCSLAAALGKMQRKSVDLEQIARLWLPLWKLGLDRAQAVRSARDPGQFFDVRYTDLMADPLATVRQIYAHFGDEFTPEAEAAMSTWLAERTHGAHESHRYAAEQYGISDDQIEREFREYADAYAIPIE